MGCAQVTSLGLQKHQFGVQPTKIIWFQIAGLDEQQLSMIKFSSINLEATSEFENFICLGKMWNYSLYNLRDSSTSGFMSQENGSKDIKNTCEDFRQVPIWKYLIKSGYKTAIFESASSQKSSIANSAQSCADQASYFSGTTKFISSSIVNASKDALKFHASEQENFKEDNTYFDRSCDVKGCFTSLDDNIFSIYKRFSNNKPYFLYIVKDYSYENAMRKKQFKTAKRILLELNNAMKLIREQSNLSETLILVSTSSAVSIDFPTQGAQWKAFENEDKNAVIKNDQLLSLTLAKGARAENFCGIYDQSELLSRLLSSPKKQGLEFIFLNPFE